MTQFAIAALLILSTSVAVRGADYPCPEDTAPMTQVYVQTSKGAVQGFHLNVSTLNIAGGQIRLTGVADVFRGIPYGEAPVGNRRLKPAIEKQAWTGTLSATKYGKICPQPTRRHMDKVSEDCLSLNVFTPAASISRHYPVMVWIHGGGFHSGSASDFCPWGIVANLVKQGVVIVSIEYRVGFFGFFTTKTDAYPANLGLRDQVLALKWVQREIHNFGGDPGKVTLFGASAGGYSVDFHTYSPMSRGLFQQAVMQSGTAKMPLALDGNDYVHNPSKATVMGYCNITSAEWDSGDFDKLEPCLRNATWQDVVFNTEGIVDEGWRVWPAVMDGPGGFLPDWPANLAKDRVANMPVIMGTAHDELAFRYILQYQSDHNAMLKWTKEVYMRVLADLTRTEQYGEYAHIVRRIVDQNYRPNGHEPAADDHVGWLKVFEKLASDKYFFAAALHQAQEWLDVNHNPNVYMYSFDYASRALFQYYPPGYTPVLHAEESMYLFILPYWNFTQISQADITIVQGMAALWTNFAKFGNPTPPGFQFSWKPVAQDHRSHYFSINYPPTMNELYWPKGTNLWDKRVPNVANQPTTTQSPMMTSQQPETTQNSGGNTTAAGPTTTPPPPKAASRIGIPSLICVFLGSILPLVNRVFAA